jgi:hypothetical protein
MALLAGPFLLCLAACVPRLGSDVGRAAVTEASPWEVSAESPVDSSAHGVEVPISPAAGIPATSPSGAGAPAKRANATGSGAADSLADAPGATRPDPGASAGSSGHHGAGNAAPATVARPAPAAGAGLSDDADLEGMPLEEQVATLRTALQVERRRREAVELQLQRLKEETSVPPFGARTVPESELLAAKQEIVDLRRALEEERSARQRLAEELLAVQERLAQRPPAETPEQRAQHEALDAAQRAAAGSFTRSFTDSQRNTGTLDTQFASAVSAAEEGDLPRIHAENVALRARLDEQHRQTQELAQKLKAATRVADLIFKMEAQPSDDAGSAAPGAAALSRPATARPASVPRAEVPPVSAPQAIAPAPQPMAPARAAAPPLPPLRSIDSAFAEDSLPEPPATSTRSRPTRTPTATPRQPSSPPATPTPQSHTPRPMFMPVPA